MGQAASLLDGGDALLGALTGKDLGHVCVCVGGGGQGGRGGGVRTWVTGSKHADRPTGRLMRVQAACTNAAGGAAGHWNGMRKSSSATAGACGISTRNAGATSTAHPTCPCMHAVAWRVPTWRCTGWDTRRPYLRYKVLAHATDQGPSHHARRRCIHARLWRRHPCYALYNRCAATAGCQLLLPRQP